MGLLAVLGLTPGAAAPPRTPAGVEDGPAAAPPADLELEVEDRVAGAHDQIAAMLKELPADKVREGFENDLAALRAKHAGGDAAARKARRKAELAAAAALHEKVQKVYAKAKQADDLAQTKLLVEAGISGINMLVLGGIVDDALRKAVNGELTKLKAAEAKAAKIGDPKAALAGYRSLLKSVQALQQKAEGARDASTLSNTLTPIATAAKTAIAALSGHARKALQAELDSVEADRRRYLAAFDATSLKSIVEPRLVKLRDLAVALPTASTKADADLARAAKALEKLDGEAAGALKSKLKTLQAEKASTWPAGKTIDEMAASFGSVSEGAAALAAEAEGLAPKLGRQREIAILRKRLDALKPRTDRAAGPADAAFLAATHKQITDALASFAKSEAAADLMSCEVWFSQIGAALDMLDTIRGLLAAVRARLAKARDGGIKEALASKLDPSSLAALRAKSIQGKQADIEAMIDGGNLVAAEKAIDTWLVSAKAWADAPAAYANLRSGKPKGETMKALIAKPGGGEVFDALVADLPDKETSTETMTTALEARFGTKVKQFNHREAGLDEAKADATYADKRQETNPKAAQKGLKDLYRILRMVPLKDVTYSEEIVDYEEKGGGAFYQHGGKDQKKDGSGTADRIVLYAGRPDDASNETELGRVVARGEKFDPDCQPVGGSKVNWYSFAALHEVAHGLDDARNVMAAHMAEAGWQEWSATDVARKVAAHYHYDAGYVEALMKGSAPAKRPARPATVKSDDDWTKAGDGVERWVRGSVVDAKPWDQASLAKANAIGGKVFHEHQTGHWVSYDQAARAKGIRGYQFRAPGEWFAELYAAFHMGKLAPRHPSASWLNKLKAESEAAA